MNKCIYAIIKSETFFLILSGAVVAAAAMQEDGPRAGPEDSAQAVGSDGRNWSKPAY